jgi:hypothetical protein
MKNPEDTATIERDLLAVDAALSNGAATDEDPSARELQELALALRADSPVAERACSPQADRFKAAATMTPATAVAAAPLRARRPRARAPENPAAAAGPGARSRNPRFPEPPSRPGIASAGSSAPSR